LFDYVRFNVIKHRLAHERQADLRAILAERGSVVVADLAKRWRVSEMTIRRDLQALEAEGSVARVHGGAVAGGRLRFGSRLERDRLPKTRAAAKLAAFLPVGGAVYLDGSTTIYHLAEDPRLSGLQVATNNLDTFLRLGRVPGVEAILIGGSLNRATDNFVGAVARRSLEGMAFAAAFFSAHSLHPQLGAAEPAAEDAEIKRLVCTRSAAIHLAVNHQKLGTTAAGCWGAEPAHSVLATDLDPDDPRLDPYRTSFRTII
jgi:DeoR family fructose operon transcriptional repressor